LKTRLSLHFLLTCAAGRFVVFHGLYFGARWVRALEFRARYFPILAQNDIFQGKKSRKIV